MAQTLYFVSVDGRSAPTKHHLDAGEAMIEAERLAAMPAHAKVSVRVFAQIAVLSPTATHRWIVNEDVFQQPKPEVTE